MKSFFTKAALGALACSATDAAKTADECKALILSGGGSNGAWEAGVFWGFLNYGNPEDFKYDVLSGISAGSINAIALAAWEIGKETEAAQWLSDLWNNLHNSDVWKKWPLEIVFGLFMEGGLLDNSPLLAFLKKVMADQGSEIQRRVSIGTVNVEDGQFTVLD